MLHNKASFMKGLALMGSFLVVFFMIFMPLFTDAKGQKQNGLEYADDLFNKLAKGSSFFVPDLRDKVKTVQGKSIDVTVKLKDPAMSADMIKVLGMAGATAQPKDAAAVQISGDLAKLLSAALDASEKLYKNDAAAVSAMFQGMDAQQAMKVLWYALNPMVKELQKAKMIEEANLVKRVTEKGIEPAYNFYGVEAESVISKLGVMTFLLIFYVVYTMWYGYAIFDLFDGIGLSMKKSKVKKEA